MSAELNSLEKRERHIIGPGTEILGGKLLARAAIVVDVDEDPEVYNRVQELIDAQVAALSGIGSEATTLALLRATNTSVKRAIPFHGAASKY